MPFDHIYGYGIMCVFYLADVTPIHIGEQRKFLLAQVAVAPKSLQVQSNALSQIHARAVTVIRPILRRSILYNRKG